MSAFVFQIYFSLFVIKKQKDKYIGTKQKGKQVEEKMTSKSIYKDISERTNGNIYIGVVGPVRTGKSTFIKKFMEATIIPNIQDENERIRAIDEMPQSASGKTVMTTEPKFVPNDAVEVTIDGITSIKVKMIDCVGYIVPEALGQEENGSVRMVNTPWHKDRIPFKDAAELGTKKVIRDHSTIGMLVTTDGSIGEIERDSYIEAEEKVAKELCDLNKPFAIILNSAVPSSPEAISLAYELEKKYNAPVALVNCMELNAEDINHIIELVLNEFPVTELTFTLPEWTDALPKTHQLKNEILYFINEMADCITKTGDLKTTFENTSGNEKIKKCTICDINSGNGHATVNIELNEDLYYKTLSETTGLTIQNEGELFSTMQKLAKIKEKYDKVENALTEVSEKGYGIVMPDVEELRLQEPQIVKQAGGYGVKLKASAQSIHMIKAEIETEIKPIVGTEQQSEELIKYMLEEFNEDPKRIWESNMFGKSLYELVNEGLHNKLEHMPEESRQKLSETLERIINEGSSGLICILL